MPEENSNPVTPVSPSDAEKKIRNHMFWLFFPTLLLGIISLWAAHPYRTPAQIAANFPFYIPPINLWLFYLLLLFLLCLFAGRAITTYWYGLLIDQRNKMSLSRLQLVMWTGLLLSGILMGILINTILGEKNPLQMVAMDTNLWALMGISGASLAASGLIKTTKANVKENPDAKAKYAMAIKDVSTATAPPLPPAGDASDDAAPDGTAGATATGETAADPVAVREAEAEAVKEMEVTEEVKGVQPQNRSAKDASWLDLFMGEETGNGAWLDMGKMQMFLFTLIVWGGYAMALGGALVASVTGAPPPGFSEMPKLSNEMVGLLGISHAAYIANKAVPQTPES